MNRGPFDLGSVDRLTPSRLRQGLTELYDETVSQKTCFNQWNVVDKPQRCGLDDIRAVHLATNGAEIGP